MITKANIDEFLAQRKIAVVGVSRNGKKYGSAIYRELMSKGYRVFPVNPQTPTINGDPCYSGLKELPEDVAAAVLVIQPSETEKVAATLGQSRIRQVWMQPGSESIKAVQSCREQGIKVVYGECLLMFLEPAAISHRLHRCLKRLWGTLPR
jgi:predicted CoA-binding protein